MSTAKESQLTGAIIENMVFVIGVRLKEVEGKYNIINENKKCHVDVFCDPKDRRLSA